MAADLATPRPDDLTEIVSTLAAWQEDAAPVQLHPGDVGWFHRFGTEATAAALRTWRRDGTLLAVGLLDGPGLLRLAVAPSAREDVDLARSVVTAATDPVTGVLPEGEAVVEEPSGVALRAEFEAAGWTTDEAWTPLRHNLSGLDPDPTVKVVEVGPSEADAFAEVLRAAFDGATSTADRWRALIEGPAWPDARCLLALDGEAPAATITVWSAGPGRPGVVEPLGVHRDHRGRGLGRAVTTAGLVALRDLGAGSAIVCTPSANTGAVATYVAAGFTPMPQMHDLRRPGA